MPQLRTLLSSTAIITGLTLALYLGLQFANPDEIQHFVASSGFFGPFIFILLKISTNVIAPLTGTPFYLIAQPVFGIWFGIFYVYIGEIAGYCICFLLARRYGRTIVIRIAGQKNAERIDQYYDDLGNKKGLLYGRLFLIGIQDVVSYAAGLTSISFRDYAVITAIGILPQTVIGVIIGGIIIQRAPLLFISYFLITTILLPALWIYYRRKSKHN